MTALLTAGDPSCRGGMGGLGGLGGLLGGSGSSVITSLQSYPELIKKYPVRLRHLAFLKLYTSSSGSFQETAGA